MNYPRVSALRAEDNTSKVPAVWAIRWVKVGVVKELPGI